MAGSLPVHDAQNNDVTLHEEIARTAGSAKVDWPLPRPSWRDEVEASYYAYMQDVAASAVHQVDVTMVMRYFDLQEMAARCFDELLSDGELTFMNNAGNTSAHPLLAAFTKIITSSIRVANEIGATPMARVKLGLNAAQAEVTARALERALQAEMEREPTGQTIEARVAGDSVVMSW